MSYQAEPNARLAVDPRESTDEGEAPPPIATPFAQVVRLDIPAELAHVHLLSRCACAMLENLPNLEEEEIIRYNLELAIQEIGVNIITHAYANRPGRIHMELVLEEQPLRLCIHFEDTGETFNPTQVPAPRLGELQEHGFGLFLIHQLIDVVEYSHSPNGNLWKLTKLIPVVG
ncbi:MAG: ATP-binding protein [Caldilineaceae bacterium]|nr:ATP-binding protein [Caldilineaceae bacterium]